MRAFTLAATVLVLTITAGDQADAGCRCKRRVTTYYQYSPPHYTPPQYSPPRYIPPYQGKDNGSPHDHGKPGGKNGNGKFRDDSGNPGGGGTGILPGGGTGVVPGGGTGVLPGGGGVERALDGLPIVKDAQQLHKDPALTPSGRFPGLYEVWNPQTRQLLGYLRPRSRR